jgi:hypothetical protein
MLVTATRTRRDMAGSVLLGVIVFLLVLSIAAVLVEFVK